MKIFYRILFLLLLLSLSSYSILKADTDSSAKKRRFEFNYSTTVQVPEGAKNVKIWLPLPHSDQNQDITGFQIKSEYPVSFANDGEYGNSFFTVTATNAKPGPLTVDFTLQVLRREYLHRPKEVLKAADTEISDPLMPRWLQPDRLVPINQRVRDLAAEVTKGKVTDLEKVRAIYDYAVTNLKYDKTGTGWGRGDIFFACDEKRGNCTDFHALVIGLARACNMPARFSMGFPLPEDKIEGAISGYHCWAEVYVKGFGWLPIDASEASKNPQKKEYFFGALDEHRVQFTIGRDVPVTGIHSDPLNYFIYPYAEIDEKPTDKIEKKFSFKNL